VSVSLGVHISPQGQNLLKIKFLLMFMDSESAMSDLAKPVMKRHRNDSVPEVCFA
jgi:hypothetical protein